MSKSFKKKPVYKDSRNTLGKKFSSRAYRRTVKTMIQAGKYEELPLVWEVYNSYDVVDYVINCFKPRFSRYAGKIRRK